MGIRSGMGIIIALSCLLVAGCGGENTPSSVQESKPKEEESPLAKAEVFQLETAFHQSGNLVIHFPQITGMEDETKEKRINDLIKNDVTVFLQQYEDVDATLDLDYQVMPETEDMLSIVYTGFYSVTGGMYPTHFLFSTNIDLKTGERRKLTDWVTIDDSFLEEFKKAPFIDWEDQSAPNEERAQAVKEFLAGMNDAELMSALKQGDIPVAKDNLYGVYSYFQGQDLIISIQVPHVLGDHGEFRIGL